MTLKYRESSRFQSIFLHLQQFPHIQGGQIVEYMLGAILIIVTRIDEITWRIKAYNPFLYVIGAIG